MKFSYVLAGVVLLLLGWWLQTPVQTQLFFIPIQIPNPLAILGLPFMLVGGVTVLYGLSVKEAKR